MKTTFVVLLGVWLAFRASADDNWLTVLDNPLVKAKAGDKLMLVDFTGSDWCGWCKKFKEETLDTPAFRDYAQKNLVLVEVDFPKQTPQDDAVKKANAAWKQRFQVDGFPTFLLINSDFKVIGRQGGYAPGGPDAFIQELEGWKARQPAAKPAAVEQADADAGQWLTDLPQAQAKAKAQNKMVLMDFEGSDWCPWCMKLKSEVFNQPEFIEYAKKNLVLVEVDFPRKTPLSDEQHRANSELSDKYKVQYFPTVILLDGDGNTLGQTGYQEGGAKSYVAMLDGMKPGH
jgi:protein disulfide-isomerase